MDFNDGIGKIRDCVGCGFCCIKSPCGAAQRLHNRFIEKCPELHWNGSRYTCKLMEKEGELGENYRRELYAGDGCCCNLNDWRRDVKPRLGEDEPTKPNHQIDSLFQKFLHTLGKQWIGGDALALTLYAYQDVLAKDGFSDEEAVSISLQVAYYLQGERSDMIDDFMGGMRDTNNLLTKRLRKDEPKPEPKWEPEPEPEPEPMIWKHPNDDRIVFYYDGDKNMWYDPTGWYFTEDEMFNEMNEAEDMEDVEEERTEIA